MYLTIDNVIAELQGYVQNPDTDLNRESLCLGVMFVLREIGVSTTGVPKHVTVPVIGGIAKYPKDLLRVNDLSLNGEPMYEVPYIDSVLSHPAEYIQLLDGIQVAWDKGEVDLTYYAVATANNEPLIDEIFFPAVVSRLVAKQNRKNAIRKAQGMTRADVSFQMYLDQDSKSEVGRARGDANMPNRARSRNIARVNKRFFKNE